MIKQRKLGYLIALILIIGIIFIIISIFGRYSITPNETYRINNTNLIDDGSFENFNKSVGDCCNSNPNMSKVYASKLNDSVEGNFSLKLTAEYQCACINAPILEFNNSNKYLLSFYYKGDNPRFCNWVNGDKKCLPNKKLEVTQEWTNDIELLTYTTNSLAPVIYLYADSRDGKTVTNLYDDLQVHKLIPIENPSEYEYNSEEEYIFKTKTDNNVKGEIISEVDKKTGEAYFIVKGKPYVTIKFPLSEIVIIVIMILIIVRLLFKKQVLQTEEEIKKEVDKIVKSVER